MDWEGNQNYGNTQLISDRTRLKQAAWGSPLWGWLLSRHVGTVLFPSQIFLSWKTTWHSKPFRSAFLYTSVHCTLWMGDPLWDAKPLARGHKLTGPKAPADTCKVSMVLFLDLLAKGMFENKMVWRCPETGHWVGKVVPTERQKQTGYTPWPWVRTGWLRRRKSCWPPSLQSSGIKAYTTYNHWVT